MRIGKTMLVIGSILMAAHAIGDAGAYAGRGPMVRMADMDGGGGVNIDLAVRQVSVTPIRAHVGDVVLIEVLIENKDEGSATTPAVVRANGKVVARQLFTWGRPPSERLYRLSFAWDTRGASPGEYNIQAEAFVWEDSSKFDNDLTVRQPLILVPPGAPFPDGQPPGGKATETDPRFGKDLLGG